MIKLLILFSVILSLVLIIIHIIETHKYRTKSFLDTVFYRLTKLQIKNVTKNISDESICTEYLIIFSNNYKLIIKLYKCDLDRNKIEKMFDNIKLFNNDILIYKSYNFNIDYPNKKLMNKILTKIEQHLIMSYENNRI